MSSRVIQSGSAVKTATRDLSMSDSITGTCKIKDAKRAYIPDGLIPGQPGRSCQIQAPVKLADGNIGYCDISRHRSVGPIPFQRQLKRRKTRRPDKNKSDLRILPGLHLRKERRLQWHNLSLLSIVTLQEIFKRVLNAERCKSVIYEILCAVVEVVGNC